MKAPSQISDDEYKEKRDDFTKESLKPHEGKNIQKITFEYKDGREILKIWTSKTRFIRVQPGEYDDTLKVCG